MLRDAHHALGPLMNLKDYGIAAGHPADVVVIDAQSPKQAIAEIRQPLAVFKRGRPAQ